MKTLYQYTIILLAACTILLACDNEDESFPEAASLKVVHAVPDAPEVHVNYFGIDDLNFALNPTLDFRSSERYTIPVGVSRNIRFTYAADTTREVLSDQVQLEAGDIATLFLIGDSANLTSALVMDVGFMTLTDSVNAIRFINMAEDVGSVNIGLEDSTVTIASGLGFTDTSDFIEFDANQANPSYSFTFKDDTDNVLGTFTFEQWQIFIDPDSPPFFLERTFRKNVTLALIGKADDGEGNSSLEVIRIDNF